MPSHTDANDSARIRNRYMLHGRRRETVIEMSGTIRRGYRTGACFFFLYVFLGVYVIRGGLLLVNAVWGYFVPAQGIRMEEVGYGYRFDLLIGYMILRFGDIPNGYPIENERMLAVTSAVIILITQVIPVILILAAGIKALRLLLISYSPFVSRMPVWFRRLGVFMILFGILGKSAMQILINYINFGRLFFENPLQYEWIIMGLLLLILSDVFRIGNKLQIDSDETL